MVFFHPKLCVRLIMGDALKNSGTVVAVHAQKTALH
jgi:hypothetical protein